MYLTIVRISGAGTDGKSKIKRFRFGDKMQANEMQAVTECTILFRGNDFLFVRI